MPGNRTPVLAAMSEESICRLQCRAVVTALARLLMGDLLLLARWK